MVWTESRRGKKRYTVPSAKGDLLPIAPLVADGTLMRCIIDKSSTI